MGSGRFGPGQTPVRYAQVFAPERWIVALTTWKTAPWMSATVSTRGQVCSSCVGFGASSSSIADHTFVKTSFAIWPAMRPRMIPMGL